MDIERDVMEVGVLFVGAGPATLAGAIRLAELVEAHNAQIEAGEREGSPIDLEASPIMIIEKGGAVGDHILSGAVVDTRALFELFTEDFLRENPPPLDVRCYKDTLALLAPAKAAAPDKASLLDRMVELILPADRAIRSPFIPPTFHNKGNYVASLSELTQWLSGIAESKGVMIMPAFPGTDLLMEDGRVVGVRTGDKGVDKEGEAKGNFEPGTDIRARLVVLGEGARGSLTKKLKKHFDLEKDANHQIYSTGVKEVWKVKPGRIEPGHVMHTAGFPLDGDTFGGGWIYGMTDNRVSIGLVTALDSPDPYLDPHRKFQEWKNHPFLARILEGGELLKAGAKTIPEGGWYSLPKLYAPGAILVGDSAGFVNISRLKGIHLAMKSGMCAGEAAFEILQKEGPTTEDQTAIYWHKVLGSWIKDELWDVRNFRQSFQRSLLGLPGMVTGTILTGSGFAIAGLLAALGVLLIGGSIFAGWSFWLPLIALFTAALVFSSSLPMGTFPLGRLPVLADHERIRRIDIGQWARQTDSSAPVPVWREPSNSAAADQVRWNAAHPAPLAPDRPIDAKAPAASINSAALAIDKVTSVYHSGSTHEEDQPAHLIVADPSICHTRCAEEYGNPCQYFCPAAVYEMVEADGGKGRQLQLNFSNCVHCKTCDIRDPYQIITWVPPEGGGGPQYMGL